MAYILGYSFNSLTIICLLNNTNPPLRSVILNIFKLAKRLFPMNKTISSQCFSECSQSGLCHSVILISSLLVHECAFWWERASSTLYLLCKLRNSSTFFFMIQICTSPPAHKILTEFSFLFLSFRYMVFLAKTSISYVKSLEASLTFSSQCHFILALLTGEYSKVG